MAFNLSVAAIAHWLFLDQYVFKMAQIFDDSYDSMSH